MDPGRPLLRASGVVHLSRREASRNLGPSAFIGDGLLVCMGRAVPCDLVAGAAVSARIGTAGAASAVSLPRRGVIRHPAALPAGIHCLVPAGLLRAADGYCIAANPLLVLGYTVGNCDVLAAI